MTPLDWHWWVCGLHRPLRYDDEEYPAAAVCVRPGPGVERVATHAWSADDATRAGESLPAPTDACAGPGGACTGACRAWARTP